jgi:predicted ABC-type ATPase
MTDTTGKRIVIIAGPNGAGKTTFAEQFLPVEMECHTFINADMIAAGLSPYNPEAEAVRAGRMMLKAIIECVQAGITFGLETTMSGNMYARKIDQWKKSGYRIQLVFLKLRDADLAVERVRTRVLAGGHDIPEQVIRRRFDAGLFNFEHIYKPLADDWILYDNSGVVPVLIEHG